MKSFLIKNQFQILVYLIVQTVPSANKWTNKFARQLSVTFNIQPTFGICFRPGFLDYIVCEVKVKNRLLMCIFLIAKIRYDLIRK